MSEWARHKPGIGCCEVQLFNFPSDMVGRRHGTGHGVGAYLGVHEGPHLISYYPRELDPPLQDGMICSIEPGYYKVCGRR